MPHNLQIENTGLDHLFINGIPIVECRIDISDIYKKVARKTAMATQADIWFKNHTQAQKMMSELHGEGDRISRDFLEDAAKDILPVFQSMQRLIPEGVYDSKPVNYEFKNLTGFLIWNNQNIGNNIVKTLFLKCTAGSGTVTIKVGNVTVGSVTLPDTGSDGNDFFAYDLSFYLGGVNLNYKNYTHTQNVIGRNSIDQIQLILSEATTEFTYDAIIATTEYAGISWNKALTKVGDIKLPKKHDDLRIAYLHEDFIWKNAGNVEVESIVVKAIDGSANVLIDTGDGGDYAYVEYGTSHGLTLNSEAIGSAQVLIKNDSENFKYDLIVTANIPDTLPSPRFEFDTNWNPKQIIYRWEWHDTRAAKDKLNYTSDTLLDIRIDKNIIQNVRDYLEKALIDYMLRELWRTIGYDKKYEDYLYSYVENRRNVAYWVKNRIRIQDRNEHAGW